MAGTPEVCEVVADGLLNPRQIAIADDGTLYVTEAGIGGDEELAPAEEEEAAEVVGSPVAEALEEAATPPADDEGDAGAGPEGEGGPPVTRGDTGQVTAVSPDGTQTVVAEGLPSYSIGAGPVGIALGDGVIWVASGGLYVPDLEPLANENSIAQITLETGEVTTLAELGSFEVANNPDGTDVNPNLYGMDLGADGQLYVADAGGNTVYRVDPTTGEFALLGVVPAPALLEGMAPPADATPSPDQPTALQPVPTGVDVGADGNVYVGTLGGFAPGAAGVLIAQADGTFVEAATGLNAVVGVALGPDGALYASQFASGPQARISHREVWSASARTARPSPSSRV